MLHDKKILFFVSIPQALSQYEATTSTTLMSCNTSKHYHNTKQQLQPLLCLVIRAKGALSNLLAVKD